MSGSFLLWGRQTVNNLVCLALILSMLLLGALGIQARRNSISAICQVVGKCMGRHLTCELTSGGILGSGHLCAPGRFVANASHAVMSCSDTSERTQVSESIWKAKCSGFQTVLRHPWILW